MAYYDKMTKKPMTKQDHMMKHNKDWALGEDRPGRKYDRDERPAYDKGVKREFGGRKGGYSDRPAYDRGAKRDFNDRPAFDRAPKRDFNDRPAYDKGPKRDFGDRPAYDKGVKRGFNDKPAYDRGPKKAFIPAGRPLRDPDQRPNDGRGPVPVRDDTKRSFAPRQDAPDRRFDDLEDRVPENLLSGRNPIREALKSGRELEKLLVAKGELSGSAREIVAMAKENHVPVQVVDRRNLDDITPHHQGMLAFASAYHYHEVDEILAAAAEKGEKPFVVILDGIQDPHNLGAIIRSAACAGAHGVIIPQRRAVGLTPAAVKASAGAVEKIMVARVTNLKRTLDYLKEQGLWLFAADMEGEDYRKVDFSGAVGLVIGSEGEGAARLTLESCDKLVRIPMTDAVESLNASVAAGILLFAIRSCRTA